MDNVWACLREFTFASVCVRLMLAMLFGGLIGIDREQKKRPAGFRTYMLVCLGAAGAMLIGQYESRMMTGQWAELASSLGVHADVSRIGAQVINGIGFLGAGTILVTKHDEVKGVTTAAGLWASACMGITIGAGCYECAVFGFLLILFSMKYLTSVEKQLSKRTRYLNLYIELKGMGVLNEVISCVKNERVEILGIEFEDEQEKGVEVTLMLYLPQQLDRNVILAKLSGFDGVKTVDQV